MHLHRDREQTVISGPRLCSDPIRHLTLHHQHCAVQYRAVVCQFHEDRRGDVIGQITNHDQLLARRCRRRSKIEREHIDVLNSHLIVFCDRESIGASLRKSGRKLPRQFLIHFNCNQLPGLPSHFPCDYTLAGSDLNHSTSAAITQRGDDFTNSLLIAQKILSEPGL